MSPRRQLIALRCYKCGLPMLGGDGVEVDLAPASQAFAELVLMHQRCSALSRLRLGGVRNSPCWVPVRA